MARVRLRWLLCLSCGLVLPTVVLGQNRADDVTSQDSSNVDASGPAIAQEPGWLVPATKPGASVRVIEKSGNSTTGRLVDVVPKAIRVASGGVTREVPLAEIAMVRRNGDPLWDGMAWGGGLAGAFFLSYNGDCDTCYSAAELASFRLALAGIGAGVGALLDLMVRDKRVLYQAPGAVTASRRLRMRPTLDRHARGFVLSAHW